MPISYSFHISSKSHAVNNISKVGQVSKHNLREYKSVDYDKNLIDVIVGSNDNLLNDIKKVYHQEFDEALKKYNQKQKRTDRKIGNYLTHVSNSRNDIAVEIIIQLGDKDFWKDKDLSDKKIMSYIFKDQIKSLEQYCPNFKIASAVIHYDESSPHIHIVGVPIAKGYKKGMEVQCAKTKVFTKESLSFLQDKMRERAEIGMKLNFELFTDIKLKDKEKGRNKDIPKHSLDEYYSLERQKKTLQQDIQSNKEEIKFWQEQTNIYMNKVIQTRDKTFELEDRNKQLKEKINKQENELASNNEILVQQAEKIKKMDNVTLLLTHTEDIDNILEDYTIPEKKGFWGKIEASERQGTFIEGMNKKQVQALIQRIKADDELQIAYDDMIKKAEVEAKLIYSEATANKNKTIAKAEEIIYQRDVIIEKAKEWAEKYKTKYKDLIDRYNTIANKFNDLLDKHNKLKSEIYHLETFKSQLEPIKQEVEELSRMKKTISGELNYEFAKTKFKDWSEFPVNSNYENYRAKGKLIALYTDGTIRQVGKNENGGWDYKTLNDKKNGLCRVGVILNEEFIRIPKSLFDELMQAKDKDKPISSNLQNLIQQQTYIKHKKER